MAKRTWQETQGETDPNPDISGTTPQPHSRTQRRDSQRTPASTTTTHEYWGNSGGSGFNNVNDEHESAALAVLQSAQGLTMLSQAEQTEGRDQSEARHVGRSRTDRKDVTIGGISRKVKACAACRKQKIKCHMENDEAPCKRCKERNLSCVLNKSLQTHMDEESRWRDGFGRDLVHIHAALEGVLHTLSLPSLPPLEINISPGRRSLDEDSNRVEAANNTLCDVSPQLSPSAESLAQVPIESLYELTRLRSLRSEVLDVEPPLEQGLVIPMIDDFISRGAISTQTAENLLAHYFSRLDHYIYGIGSSCSDLPRLRRASPILTACICTVSALHEADNIIYDKCNKEFRRLIAESMFDRQLSLDYLRALCIGSFWLSDISWTLSGMAVRRTGDFRFEKYYHQSIGSQEISTPASQNSPPVCRDHVRLWYLLFICDQHLSILYNRAPMIREDETILGWREYSESLGASDADMRISSQVALLLIMTKVRDLFGTNTSQPIPKAFSSHMTSFGRELDKWLAQWSHALRPNEFIGDFPSKGVLLHSHFGKLHLYSHVFWGLKVDGEVESIPSYFKTAASIAVSSAISILELLQQDNDLRKALGGVPHYFHTMIAFAGVFLLKVSGKYCAELSIDLESVYSLTSSVIDLFRSIECSRYHLVRWMAQGLEKMLIHTKKATSRSQAMAPPHFNGNTNGLGDHGNDWVMDQANYMSHDGSNQEMPSDFNWDMNLLMSDFPPGNFDLGFNFP